MTVNYILQQKNSKKKRKKELAFFNFHFACISDIRILTHKRKFGVNENGTLRKMTEGQMINL